MADTIIEVFEGRLGGGKTYSAVERIFAHLCRGGIVYTNIRLHWENVAHSAKSRGILLDPLQYQYLDNEKVCQFNRHIAAGTDEMPVLVALDEAHLFFNARDWNKVGRVILDTLTQIRKVSINLVLITQSQLNLDKQFVRMTQYVWRFRDMRKVNMPVLGIPWPLNQILQVCFDAQDTRFEMHRKLKFKDPEIFNWYESKALFTDLGLLSEPPKVNMRRMTRRELWQHRKESFSRVYQGLRKNLKPAHVMKALLLLLALIGIFTVSMNHLFGGKKQEPVAGTSSGGQGLVSSTKGVFGGDAAENKHAQEYYHSNYTAFVGGQFVRVGGTYQGHRVYAIDPVSRLIGLEDADPVAY